MEVFMVKATNKYGVKSTQLFSNEVAALGYEKYLSQTGWTNISVTLKVVWSTVEECKDALHVNYAELHAGIAKDFDCSLCKECDKYCPFA